MGVESSNVGAVLGPAAGGRVVDSPVLLLVCFHKAIRAELTKLHGLATTGQLGKDGILELRRRYRFLQVVYKYHCFAEDEVFFRALDLRVRNVAFCYSLEHSSINEDFDLVFHWLDILSEDNETPFHELGYFAGTIKKSICQHMLKEEEQVIPLLIEQFSFEEQASFVWQFLCSVPVILLEDILPWMMSYLSDEEQDDVLYCIKEVVPKENLLQAMVTSWIGRKNLHSYGASAVERSEKVELYLHGFLNFKDLPVVSLSMNERIGIISRQIKFASQYNSHPIDGLRHWHNAIEKELKSILEELQEIQKSKAFSNLSSISGRILFITDILIYYSDALEKVVFPVLTGSAHETLSFSYSKFPDEKQVEGLLCALQNLNRKTGKMTGELVTELHQKLDLFIVKTSEHFSFQEAKIFSVIHKKWNHEMQLSLLYASIQMMPLSLLKCVIIWMSAQLTEEEARTLLLGISLAGPSVNVSFAALLHKWLLTGYSGKTSLADFRNELDRMYRNRSAYIHEQFKEMNVFSSLNLDLRPCKKPHPDQAKASPAEKPEGIRALTDESCDLWLCDNSSCYKSHRIDNCSYSSRINLQIFFSEATKKISPFFRQLREESDASSSSSVDLNPIDHLFLYHRALRNELENFVLQSAKMINNVEIFKDFHSRFILVEILYEAHSNAEDEVVFPALEAKGSLQNISGSYIIDHKLEAEHFKNISSVLNDILKLQASLASERSPDTTVDLLHDRRIRYQDLCLTLHGMCKSLKITLEQHMDREETELWPKFLELFSKEEQENLIGSVIGRTKAEVLQSMLPWLIKALTPIEQQSLLNCWRKATQNTMFNDWLREWWKETNGVFVSTIVGEADSHPEQSDSLKYSATHLPNEGFRLSLTEVEKINRECRSEHENVAKTVKSEHFSSQRGNHEKKLADTNRRCSKTLKSEEIISKSDEEICQDMVHATKKVEGDEEEPVAQEVNNHYEPILTITEEDLEAAARKVSHDSTLGPEEKTRLIQNLIMSRWISTQKRIDPEVIVSRKSGELPGHFASYRDCQKKEYGCEHYKRNCKLLATCCNRLVPCRYCHDDASDHSMDPKSATQMMCMKCLYIQPLSAQCTNPSCSISMAKYFCNICRLFDDEREIYHCPFCNLCRVGKGLGVDYFHCMKCNACMSKFLSVHICREKCFESNCPICFDEIFTSSSPIKALPCGHMMHSACFQEYTCSHYTCPICSKSLGDMQVYFGMLDALLAEEKIPDEYHDQTQGILCHDCEKKGTAPFHWLYHKCQHCGSYNTRLL